MTTKDPTDAEPEVRHATAVEGQAKSRMQMACEERADFADLLAGLTLQEWEHPSLCERWRVRDVVAHYISFDELSHWGLVWRFAKGGFLPGPVNQVGVDEYATHSSEQLTMLMRSCIPPRGLTSYCGGLIALVDGMVHQQDIRRPLKMPRTIPPQRLRAVLNYALTYPFIRGAIRARGVQLVATDLDWTHGHGPEVNGPGEALLMAMAARADALSQLTGPGKPLLAERVCG